MLSFFILEFFFGALEAFATLVITVVVFRLPLRFIYLQIIGLSFFISSMSLLLYNLLGWPFFIGETINLTLTIVFFVIYVQLQWGHSVIVTFTGYLLANLIQGINYVTLSTLQLIEGEMIANTAEGLLYLMTFQMFYALLSFHLAFLIYYFRWGFTFSSAAITKLNLFEGKNINIASIIILSLFTCLYIGHLFVYNEHIAAKPIYFIIFLTAALLSLTAVYLLNRKHINNEWHQIQQDIRF